MYWFYIILAVVDMICAARMASTHYLGWMIYSLLVSIYCLFMADLYTKETK